MTTSLEDDLRREIGDSVARHLLIRGFICDARRYRGTSIWPAVEKSLPQFWMLASEEKKIGEKLMDLADALGIEPGNEPCVARESQGTDQEPTGPGSRLSTRAHNERIIMAISATLTGDEKEFVGPAGWANRIEFPPNIAKNGEICTWLLYAPDAHPMWAFHLLYAVHLRAQEGLGEPYKEFPDATHEIGVISLNPENQPYTEESYTEILRTKGPRELYLTPFDALVQVSASDEQAKRVTAYAARSAAYGALIPDSDYREHWDRAIKDTLQHEQTGGHT